MILPLLSFIALFSSNSHACSVEEARKNTINFIQFAVGNMDPRVIETGVEENTDSGTTTYDVVVVLKSSDNKKHSVFVTLKNDCSEVLYGPRIVQMGNK